MLSDETKEGMRNAASDDYFAARPHIDSRYNRCMFEAGFDRACRAIEAEVLEELAKQEPVAFGWRDVVEELPTEAQEVLFVRDNKVVHGAWIGGIFWHSNTKMAASKWMPLPPVELPLLYAAPVVQPDMVMVPREPTEAMLDAPEVRIDAPCFGCGDTAVTWGQLAEIYRAMIAAAEGKSNAALRGGEAVPLESTVMQED